MICLGKSFTSPRKLSFLHHSASPTDSSINNLPSLALNVRQLVVYVNKRSYIIKEVKGAPSEEGGGGKKGLGNVINTLPKAKSETTLPGPEIVEQ